MKHSAMYNCHHYYYYYISYYICCILFSHQINITTYVRNLPSSSSSFPGVIALHPTATTASISFHSVKRGGGGGRCYSSSRTIHFDANSERPKWKSLLSSSSSSASSSLLYHSTSSAGSDTTPSTTPTMSEGDNIDTTNNDQDRNKSNSVTIGVIGCGTIASAIVTGLAKYQPSSATTARSSNSSSSTNSNLHIERIVVTKRSAQKSSVLQSSYPNVVSISETNQHVLDVADIIFITVLPNQTAAVLQELQFSPQRHILISLVSTCSIDSLRRYSQLPHQQVYKMICLPGVQYNNDGICLLQIPSTDSSLPAIQHDSNIVTTVVDEDTSVITLPELMNLLGILGHVVTVTSDEQMSTYMVPTGLMGLLYGIIRTNRDWILNHDDTPDTTTISDKRQQQQQQQQRKIATKLVLRCYNNMIQDAIRRLDDDDDDGTDLLEELIQEQTSGGLNEQALANGMSIMNIYEQVQDAMLLRILGKSDGSMPVQE